jgi:hypothetical protein
MQEVSKRRDSCFYILKASPGNPHHAPGRSFSRWALLQSLATNSMQSLKIKRCMEFFILLGYNTPPLAAFHVLAIGFYGYLTQTFPDHDGRDTWLACKMCLMIDERGDEH